MLFLSIHYCVLTDLLISCQHLSNKAGDRLQELQQSRSSTQNDSAIVMETADHVSW